MFIRTLVISSLLLVFSCGSYNSMDSFYNAHKNDNQVTAVRVPQFMLSLLGTISPEMKSLIGNTKDLRYMQFPSATAARTQFLNAEMNNITGNSFIEVYRKNDDLRRNVVSVREKKSAVKEILIYTNNNLNASFLYFKGNFDPEKVRKMAQNEDFQKIGKGLNSQINMKNRSIDQKEVDQQQ